MIVTHDFEDAASLADRVGVLVDGRLLQLGTPSELVASPRDRVRRGLHRARTCSAASPRPGRDGLTEVALDAAVHRVDRRMRAAGRVALAVYPWEVSVAREPPDDSAVNHLRAPIASIVTAREPRRASASAR